MPRVAVLDDYQNVARDMADWESLLDDVTVDVFSDHLSDEDEVAERLGPYDIIVAMRERTPFQRTLIRLLPNLKLLVTTGMRNASIDVSAASDHGVTVCGTDGLPYPTAELTWALILALARKVPTEDSATRAGGWQVTMGEGLQGKTLGVIGLGRLGSQVATVGCAFGMDVIAWSQNLTAARSARVRSQARLERRTPLFSRRGDDTSGAQRPHPRAYRQARTVTDEAVVVLGEHLTRADRG